MMWDRSEKKGVLNDFDLPTLVSQNEIADTFPFMALDLLTTEGMAGEISPPAITHTHTSKHSRMGSFEIPSQHPALSQARLSGGHPDLFNFDFALGLSRFMRIPSRMGKDICCTAAGSVKYVSVCDSTSHTDCAQIGHGLSSAPKDVNLNAPYFPYPQQSCRIYSLLAKAQQRVLHRQLRSIGKLCV